MNPEQDLFIFGSNYEQNTLVALFDFIDAKYKADLKQIISKVEKIIIDQLKEPIEKHSALFNDGTYYSPMILMFTNYYFNLFLMILATDIFNLGIHSSVQFRFLRVEDTKLELNENFFMQWLTSNLIMLNIMSNTILESGKDFIKKYIEIHQKEFHLKARLDRIIDPQGQLTEEGDLIRKSNQAINELINENKTISMVQVAKKLGIPRSTYQDKLGNYGIDFEKDLKLPKTAEK